MMDTASLQLHLSCPIYEKIHLDRVHPSKICLLITTTLLLDISLERSADPERHYYLTLKVSLERSADPEGHYYLTLKVSLEQSADPERH